MNVRSLLGITILSIASATAGLGLSAYFSDTAISTDNLFTAGTIDMRLDGQDSLGGFIGGGALRPGDTLSADVQLSNAGTVGGALVDLDIAIDTTRNQGPDASGDMAAFLRINDLSYGGVSHMPSDINGNGFSDLDDWDRNNVETRDLPEPAGGTLLSLSITFDTSAGNDLQGDSVDVTMNFFLSQALADDLAETYVAWQTLASMPVARQATGGGVVDGIFYVAGGYNDYHRTDVIAYDLATDTWTTKANRPSIQTNPGSEVIGGLLYTAGGSDCCVSFGQLWTYHPPTDTWTQKASMATNHQFPGTGVVNGKLYVVGGANSILEQSFTTAVEMYDPSTNTWTNRAPIPDPWARGVGATVDGILYIIGGNSPGGPIGTVYAYNAATDSWSTRTPMPTARYDPAMALIDGIIYVIGGGDPNAVALATVEAYDPSTDTWTTLPDMPTPRIAARAGVVGSTVVVAGGYSGTTTYSVVEAFTP